MPRLGAIELGRTPCLIAAATDRDWVDTGWCALADAVELRVDEFAAPTPAGVERACAAARALGKPILGTVRWSAEGGAGALDDAQRRALYEALAPRADGLDVELRSPLRDDVVALARRPGRLAVVSAHCFDATPPDALLAELLAEGGRRGDVVKLAAAARSAEDLGRLADLLRRPGPPRIVIAMGAEGAASRVFFPLLGSLLTYSFAGTPTAPGQLDLPALYDALRQFSPAFAATHPARR
ncbi:MAG: type I 3-dehydroquinate dehydratase [Candidatus Binatia bacterium]